MDSIEQSAFNMMKSTLQAIGSNRYSNEADRMLCNQTLENVRRLLRLKIENKLFELEERMSAIERINILKGTK